MFGADEAVNVVTVPTFGHSELVQIWHALQQYVDNHTLDENDCEQSAPIEAQRALEALDTYMASFAEIAPSGAR